MTKLHPPAMAGTGMRGEITVANKGKPQLCMQCNKRGVLPSRTMRDGVLIDTIRCRYCKWERDIG